MKKICFRCKKEIIEGSHHYDFVEYKEKKVANVDSAHKNCWDVFLKKVSSVENAQNFLSRINLEPLEKMGLMKPQQKEVVIP